MAQLYHTHRTFALSAFLTAAALLTAIRAVTAFGLSENAVNTLTLENQMEERLRPILVEITGSDRVIVLVSTDTQSEGGKKQDAVLLPGVPIKKEAKNDQENDANAFKSSLSKLVVKKLTVTVILDAGISEAMKETIRDVAAGVLGMNKTRGDELYIRQIDFQGKRFSWSSLVHPPNLSLLFLSLTGGFFLVIAALFLRNPFNKLGDVLKNAGFGGGGAAAEPAGSAPLEKNVDTHTALTGPPAVRENPDTQQTGTAALPFAFVREPQLANLAFLLQDKAAKDVATVLSYIGPELASKLLEFFPEEKKIEFAMGLSAVDINPEKTRALEEKIREELDYVVGGEQKLAALLDATDEEIREKIIARIEKKDAETARRLRKQIRDLDAFLRDMPASGISLLYRQVDASLFAQVLKETPADIQQKVFASLSAGAGERLKQEIDMSRPLNPARLKKEKQSVVAVIRRLIKEGSVEVENN